MFQSLSWSVHVNGTQARFDVLEADNIRLQKLANKRFARIVGEESRIQLYGKCKLINSFGLLLKHYRVCMSKVGLHIPVPLYHHD